MTSPVSHWLVLVDRYHYAILGAALVLMLVIGLLAPRRTLGPGRWKRWAVNLILAGLGLAPDWAVSIARCASPGMPLQGCCSAHAPSATPAASSAAAACSSASASSGSPAHYYGLHGPPMYQTVDTCRRSLPVDNGLALRTMSVLKTGINSY